MKNLFTLFALVLCLTNLKAQFVTIPDANFVTWLQANVPSAMSGNQMDTTSLAVINRTNISVGNLAISNLTGIQYFDSLKLLDCGNTPYGQNANVLTTLPKLPSTLNALACYNNQLSSLPPLPNTLDTLMCYKNFITNLSYLPNQLTYLNCSANALDSIPNLPNSINYLNCAGPMNIYNLPSLPNSLETLICGTLLLNNIPPLPNSLKNLDCSINGLTTLPTFPASLVSLSCGYNQFSNLPTLPNGLLSLSCQNNQFASLPNLNPSLQYLDCNHNQLTTLPTLPNSLTFIYCVFNQLVSLPTLPNNLQNLYCSYNNLSCFPPFPNSFSAYSTSNYNFDISNNPYSCLPNYIAAMDPTTLAVPLCSYGNINQCPLAKGITGYIYSDNMVNNCIRDSGDFNQNNIPLKIYNQLGNLLGSTYSASNGVYSFPQLNNTYTVKIDTNSLPLKSQCLYPGLDSTFFVSTLDTNINFALTCKNGVDVGVQSIVTSGVIFPGIQHHLKILAGDMSHWYNLNCANGTSGLIQISVTGNVTYDGAGIGAITPSTLGNTFTYNISDFGLINNITDFDLLFTTDTNAQAGQIICVTVTVTSNSGDNNLTNNTYTYCYNVVNSYDPNIKETYPQNVQPGFNDWLTYTIHFQNTGNAPAFNIRIADTLDTRLNLETFQVINYSHQNLIDLTGRVLNVRFPNIQLPDSTTNSAGSIGFIQYRIKPKATWVAPYQIKNTAYIYFDYNAPIITNTTLNTILIPTGLQNQTETVMNLYPNPSNGNFTIELNTKEKQSIQVFDITGNVVLSQSIENGKATIEANHLAPGIYNINIKGSNSVANKKLVIVK